MITRLLSRLPLPLVLANLVIAGCTTTGMDGQLTFGAADDPDPAGQSVETLVGLGDYAAVRGDPMSAVALYRRAHMAEPQALTPLMRLGAALARVGSYDEAAGAYRAALRIEPVSAEAQRGLGNALVAAGRPAEGLPHLETALSLANDPRAYNSIGVALDMLGRHEDAQFYYRQGLALAGEDIDLRSNLALSLSLSGREEEAIALARSVAAAPNARLRHRQNLALVLALAGRTADAEDVARLDFDEQAVQRNMQYFASLRAIPDSGQRAAAIGGAGGAPVGP